MIGHDRRDSRRAFDDRQRDRSRDGFKREPSYEYERRPRSPLGDRDEQPISGRGDSSDRECSPLTGDDEHDDRKDSTRSIRRDLTKNYTKENDPYWYPGKGKYSHPTKMPSQNPHDPKPRNPKRTQSCRTESPGHRHERIERKHDRREDEKERLLNGDIGTPPPDAGPNWAKNRIATLEKYAKRTKKRHKKHEKRMRKAGEQT
ncbi:hypothetical protein J4E93_010633 [Alternaria ventricosa]|uniref:uncharacterized protein n=1 Tax=Alternaria ventricosa TaxID=1187951 RepID=UPI0020C517A5|nr:uncharacterized protein J4E93_010633 [Alternaria ventricosa]KAI4637117.1 hypothetical protein J4E93_010633 [Alternaria ventricosa]